MIRLVRTWWRNRNHHLLDLRNEFYTGGWSDVDARMLYACFNLLEDFVILEDGLNELKHQVTAWGLIGPNFDEERWREAERNYEEVFALYHWWIVERPARVESEYFDDTLYAQDTAMLQRLISIRYLLWT